VIAIDAGHRLDTRHDGFRGRRNASSRVTTQRGRYHL
jgi:hypothetical protein